MSLSRIRNHDRSVWVEEVKSERLWVIINSFHPSISDFKKQENKNKFEIHENALHYNLFLKYIYIYALVITVKVKFVPLLN
jgi:hypothetical protein